jgi:hypothetical protein
MKFSSYLTENNFVSLIKTSALILFSEIISDMPVTKSAWAECEVLKRHSGRYALICGYHQAFSKPRDVARDTKENRGGAERSCNITHFRRTQKGYLRHCCSERSVGKLS